MKIGVFTHIKPDADAFGTAIALAILNGIKAWFHSDDVSLASPFTGFPASIRAIIKKFPKVLNFIGTFGGYYDDDSEVPVSNDNIVVDCGDPARVSATEAVKTAGFAISYDHHCNAPVADVEMGNPHAPAAAAVVANAVALQDHDPVVATLLFAGLAGDTQGFSNTASTAEAFETAAKLIRHGADANLVLEAIHQESLARARLKAAAVASLQSRVRMDPEGGAVVGNFTVLTKADFAKAKAAKADYAGMPGEVLAIGDAEYAACLCFDEKQEGLYRIAFRTKPSCSVRAQDMAKAFGGNGHPDAAGGQIEASSAEEALKAVADKMFTLFA